MESQAKFALKVIIVQWGPNIRKIAPLAFTIHRHKRANRKIAYLALEVTIALEVLINIPQARLDHARKDTIALVDQKVQTSMLQCLAITHQLVLQTK